MGGLRDASPTLARVSDDISPRPPGRAAATWPRNTRRSRWGRRGSRRAASPPSSRTMRGAADAHHGQPARADRARSGPALTRSGIGYPEHRPLRAQKRLMPLGQHAASGRNGARRQVLSLSSSAVWAALGLGAGACARVVLSAPSPRLSCLLMCVSGRSKRWRHACPSSGRAVDVLGVA